MKNGLFGGTTKESQKGKRVPRPLTEADIKRKIYKDAGMIEQYPKIRHTMTRLERMLSAIGVTGDLAGFMTQREADDFKASLSGLEHGRTSGTTPELLVVLWMKEHGYRFAGEGPSANLATGDFAFQFPLDGGRQRQGGAVADIFITAQASHTRKGTVVRVNGTYWHKIPQVAQRDYAQWLQLIAKGYKVVDIADTQILAPGGLDQIMKQIL